MRAGGVVAAGLLVYGASSEQASAQSLASAVGNAINGGCSDFGARPLGPQLAAICGAGPAAVGVNAPTGGSVEGQAEGAQNLENALRRRLNRAHEQASLNLLDNEFCDPDDAADLRFGRISAFAAADYQNTIQQTTYFTPGYHSDRAGATIGADTTMGVFVVGAALNLTSESGDFRSSGGNFANTGYGGYIYGSVLPTDNFFVDWVVGYTYKDMRLNRAISYTNAGNAVTANGIAHGNTGSNEVRFGLSSGYDFYYKNISYGPRVGMNYSHNDINGFRENGNTGLELSYSPQTFESFTTTIGMRTAMAISTGFGVIVPQAELDYMHEFRNNQQVFTAHFVQDLSSAPLILSYQNDNPRRDYFGVSAGVSLVLAHGISPYLNYRAILGDPLKMTQTVTAGARFEF